MASKVKQRIIETASKLFYQQGYNLTGINEVIKEAGIAKATLYHHFASKEDLCLAYLEYRHLAFIKDLQEYLSKLPPKRRLLGVFDFLQDLFDTDGFKGCWCLNTYSELPKDHNKVKKAIQQQKDEFLNLLQDIVASNRGKKGSTLLAKRIYLLYEGAINESQLLQNSWPISEAKKMAQAII